MCGIVGIRSSRRDGVDAALVRMVESVRHRGPDDRGREVHRAGSVEVGLGQTRLAILDLSAAGHQPMIDEATGNRIVFNGEVYNFRAVRAELDRFDPRPWRSGSDTEVMLRAYAVWGRDALARLRGMFAFALWDEARGGLLLARDRLGIKPLYIAERDGVVAFASEVRALLASGLVEPRLDVAAVAAYLSYQCVPAPRTMIDGVRSLGPGAWLWIDRDGAANEGRYWDLLADASTEVEADGDGTRRRLADLLAESVDLHMVSDVPVAAFLSGGIDSSAVVALMRVAGVTPQTFSVVFAEGDFDEAPYARLVAQKVGAEHTEIPLSEGALLAQLPEALAAMDQPTGDAVNTYVVARAVREAGIKVALSGLGGDELFGGYPSFRRLGRASEIMRVWQRSPAPVRRLAARTIRAAAGSSVRTAKIADLVASDGTLASAFPLTRRLFSPEQRFDLLVPELALAVADLPDAYEPLLRRAFDGAGGHGTMSLISYAEARTYMHDLLLRDTDQMSMAHALEVRVPLLDHKLVEFVMGLPDAVKLPNGTPKRLLVESLGSLLPEEIYRRPKRGFVLPFSEWMRGALRGFCEERLSPERTRARGLFRPEHVSRLWQAFLEGSAEVSWSRLWSLVVLEEWLERNGVALP